MAEAMVLCSDDEGGYDCPLPPSRPRRKRKSKKEEDSKEFSAVSTKNSRFPDDPELAMQVFIEALKNPESFKKQSMTISNDHKKDVPSTSRFQNRTSISVESTDTTSSTHYAVELQSSGTVVKYSNEVVGSTHTMDHVPSFNIGNESFFNPLAMQQYNVGMNGMLNSVVPNQSFQPTASIGYPAIAFTPAAQYLQTHFMEPSSQFCMQNVNMGLSPGIPSVVNSVQNELAISQIPDGSGLVKYAAPNINALELDPILGYRYDRMTGLHYDANSGYFFNSKLRFFLYWDPLSQTYLRVQNSAVPFPDLQSQNNSEEQDLQSQLREQMALQNESYYDENETEGRLKPERSPKRKSDAGTTDEGNDKTLINVKKLTENSEKIPKDLKERFLNKVDSMRRKKALFGTKVEEQQSCIPPDKAKHSEGDFSVNPVPLDEIPLGEKSLINVKKQIEKFKKSLQDSNEKYEKNMEIIKQRSLVATQRLEKKAFSFASPSSDHMTIEKLLHDDPKKRICNFEKRMKDLKDKYQNNMEVLEQQSRIAANKIYRKAFSGPLSETNHLEVDSFKGKDSLMNSTNHSGETLDYGVMNECNQENNVRNALSLLVEPEIQPKMGDSNAFHDEFQNISLYSNDPTLVVHVIRNYGKIDAGFQKCLGVNLRSNNINYKEIAFIRKTRFGSPFPYLQVTFESISECKRWFFKTNREITLQLKPTQLAKKFYLRYAGMNWRCKNCANENMFLRSLCFWCNYNKSGSCSSVKISTAPTKFLRLNILPFFTNKNNLILNLPKSLQSSPMMYTWNCVYIIKDPVMSQCCALVVFEMPNAKDAMSLRDCCKFLRYVDIDSNSPDLVNCRVNINHHDNVPFLAKRSRCSLIEEDQGKSCSEYNIAKHRLDLSEPSGIAEESLCNPVPSPSDSFSQLYPSNPTRLIHVRSLLEGESLQNVFSSLAKTSLCTQLVEYGIIFDKVINIPMYKYGCPFPFILIIFTRIEDCEQWFLKNNRGISLNYALEMKADFFLQYAKDHWRCTNCSRENIFFRSLCHWCYCYKSGLSFSVRISEGPTRFLTLTKVPSTTNKYNVKENLPIMMLSLPLKSVYVIEDPNMKCCCGLVIEMSNLEDAGRMQQSCTDLRYVDLDCASPVLSKCQVILDTSTRSLLSLDEGKQDIKPSHEDQLIFPDPHGSAVETSDPRFSDPLSYLYTGQPTCKIHVKSSVVDNFNVNSMDIKVVKNSLLQHLNEFGFEFVNTTYNPKNSHGCPFPYVEVIFKYIDDGKQWLLKTNRKMTLQCDSKMRSDFFLQYAGDDWCCNACNKINVFFRSLCFWCLRDRNGSSSSITISTSPTRFLYSSKIPYTITKLNVMAHLQKHLRIPSHYPKSAYIIRDPKLEKYFCIGLVLEMPDTTMERRLGIHFRYVDFDYSSSNQAICKVDFQEDNLNYNIAAKK